jgi:ADP-heptose:LPS heptosyltransferase
MIFFQWLHLKFKFFFSYIFFFVINLYQVMFCLFYNKKDINYKKKSQKVILVIRTEKTLGDNLLTLYFIHKLKENYKGYKIHLVCHESVKFIYQELSAVDNLIGFIWNPRSIFSLIFRLKLTSSVFSDAFRTNYEYAFSPRWDVDHFAPFISWFSNASKKIGYSSHVNYHKSRFCLFLDFLYSNVYRGNVIGHEVNSHERLLYLDKKITSENSKSYHLFLDKFCKNSFSDNFFLKFQRKKIIIISPGASSLRRKWPLENYIKLINKISQTSDFNFLIIGKIDERQGFDYIRKNARRHNVYNLCGQMSLSSMYSLIKASDMYIGNDSGLLHLASFANARILLISCHPLNANEAFENSPERFGPFSSKFIILRPNKSASLLCSAGCISNNTHCINKISVESAYKAFISLREG